MKLSNFGTVFKKEIVDALRDRKALATILITPTLNIIVIVAMINIGVYLRNTTDDVILPVQNMEQALPLMDWLEENGVTVRPSSENAIQKVRNNQLDFLLVVPEDFADEFGRQQSTTLELVYDQSRKDLGGKVAKIKMTVMQWSTQIGALRLIVRGVSPEIMQPVTIRDNDVSEADSRSAMIFGVIALILTITIFTTSIGVSIDMMAGEREKNSLEALLISPASRWSLLMGKWANSVFITWVVLAVVVMALHFIIPNLPMEKLGMRGEFSLQNALALIAIATPLVLVSTILQLLVSIFSRSYKEAQSYIGLMVIIPVMVGYYVLWSDVAQSWQYTVPLMSTQMLMEDVMSTGSLSLGNYSVSALVSLGVALALAAVTVKQLNREKIIYG